MNESFVFRLVSMDRRVDRIQKIFTTYHADIDIFLQLRAFCLNSAQYGVYPGCQNDCYVQLNATYLVKGLFQIVSLKNPNTFQYISR